MDYVGLRTVSCMGAIWRYRKAQLMGPLRSLIALKRHTKGKIIELSVNCEVNVCFVARPLLKPVRFVDRVFLFVIW